MSKYTKDIFEIIKQSNLKKEVKNYTVKEWFLKYLLDYCPNIKTSTYASYKQAVHNHIIRILGDVPLNEIGSEVIQFFIKVMTNGDEEASPLAAKTIKNVYGVLHKGLLIAYKLGYMESNIENMMIVLPRIDPNEIAPLSNEEIMLLLSHIQGSQYHLIITAALFTGMRESELLGLRWCDIDFTTGTINISRQLVRDKITRKFVLTTLKNNKPRSIKPAPFLMKLLRKAYTDNRQSFVFVNPQTGNHLSHNAVYRYLKKASHKAFGRDNVRFHDLRHTYAVLSLQAGDDYKTLQENMGHFSASFTLDKYGHCTDTMKSVSSQKMEMYYQQHLT